MRERVLLVLGSLLPTALVLCVLAAGVWLGLELRRRAAPVSFAPETVVERDSIPVVLGGTHLGQHPGPKSAASRHLHVDRSDGHWRIANAAQDRRVFAKRESGQGFYLHRWLLEPGDRILLSSAEIEVKEASSRLVLRDVDSGRSASFDAGVLDPGGEAVHLVCHSPVARFARDLRWRFRELAEGDAVRLLSVGGGVNCTSRWSLPALEPQAIHIEWIDGGYQVAPGSNRSDVVFKRGGRSTSFNARMVVVDAEDPVTSVILGRTVYAISTDPDTLTLSPVANRDLWRDEAAERSLVDVAWSGAGLGPQAWLLGQGLWLVPGAVVALLVGFVVRTRLSGRRALSGNAPTATALGIGLAALGAWVTLLTQRGEAADALSRYFLVIASLGYATFVLAVRGRLYGIGGLVWVTAASLALVGTLVLLTLGAGAENTIWMRYFDKHAVLLTGFGWGIAALAALPTNAIRSAWIGLFNSESIVAGAGVLLLFGMAAQLAIGTEAGVGGIQPVELTKSVYVLLLAFAGMNLMEMRRRDSREYRRSPIAAVLPFLRTIGGFALLVLSVVVGVRDFSPGIILGLVTFLWLFRVGRSVRSSGRPALIWRAVRPVVVIGLAAVVAAAAWARANPEKLPAGMPQRDRILVWSQPELHPHSGSQVLAGMDRVAEGDWRGARDWFGNNEEVMKVPAVQDDFITAFLLNRFGGYAGMALLGLQLLYLMLLFTISGSIERATESGDFREQQAGRVLGFALYGLGWMHAIHWAIAWCNTLGLLPVMGQPMTWLSAGNSHLMGFALLSLVIALVTSWIARAPAAEV